MIKLINFKDYEVIKVISEQLRSASWALAGVFTYFGWTKYKFISGIIVLSLWAFLQMFSLVMVTSAKKLVK